jgi:hypothetical protein
VGRPRKTCVGHSCNRLSAPPGSSHAEGHSFHRLSTVSPASFKKCGGTTPVVSKDTLMNAPAADTRMLVLAHTSFLVRKLKFVNELFPHHFVRKVVGDLGQRLLRVYPHRPNRPRKKCVGHSCNRRSAPPGSSHAANTPIDALARIPTSVRNLHNSMILPTAAFGHRGILDSTSIASARNDAHVQGNWYPACAKGASGRGIRVFVRNRTRSPAPQNLKVHILFGYVNTTP